MPRYTEDISELLYEEDVGAMYNKAKSPAEAFLVSILWTTGARPSEILQLRKDDFTYADGTLNIRLKTMKLGAGKEYKVRERTLSFERPMGLDANRYLEMIIRYVSASNSEGFVLNYGSRWCEKAINRLGMETIGKKLTPYHFRHSVLNWLSAKGHSTTELMHFKGCLSVNSVSSYLHARPFILQAKNLQRGRGAL